MRCISSCIKCSQRYNICFERDERTLIQPLTQCIYRSTHAYRLVLRHPRRHTGLFIHDSMYWTNVRVGPVDRKSPFHGKQVILSGSVRSSSLAYTFSCAFSRFLVGYIKGVVKHRACPIKLSIKVAESDKHAMVKTLHSAQSLKFHPPFTLSTSTTTSPSISSTSEDTNDASEDASKSEGPTKTTVIPPGLGKEAEVLPPLRFASDTSETEGWITFDRPVSYMYAGKGPYVSVDLMQFPVSLPDDGFIDIVVQEQVSSSLHTSLTETDSSSTIDVQMTRGDLIKAMDGAEVGKCFWMNSVSGRYS